jgi:hypothetical protein
VRNRLVNKISKVISIVGPIHRGQLKNLLERRRPFETLPPDEVLLEVYRRIPWILVREDTITVREDRVTRMELCDANLPPQ